MSEFIKVEKGPNGFATLTIRRDPVNSMNLELWQELRAGLSEVEADPNMRGLILQSGLSRDVFTAGNDLTELYAPQTTEARYKSFWVNQTQFLAELYSSRLATVAAIRGACPAGGCALALCSDYRVMTDFGNIGLNEVAIGIPVPLYWAGLMQRTIGQRPAEEILLNGLMPAPAEALAIGLIDKVVAAAELTTAAEAAMTRLLQVNSFARHASKLHLRASFAREWAAYAEEEARLGWKLINQPQVVKALEQILAKLSKPKDARQSQGYRG